MKYKICAVICMVCILMQLYPAVFAEEENVHPFLIVKASEFDEIRARADKWPWNELKKTAIEDAKNLKYNKSPDYVTACNELSAVIGSCGLAYILDPKNKDFYIEKIISHINYWNADTEGNIYDGLYKSTGDHWTTAVPPASTFVSSLLALDIIYPELTQAQLKRAEDTLEIIADNYWTYDENHMVAILGVRGLWSAYERDWERAELVYDEYIKLFDRYISEDGVGSPGVDYSVDRFSTISRTSKWILPVIMEYTGRVDDFFSNPKYQDFANWCMGYIYGPAGHTWLTGDSSAGSKLGNALHKNAIGFLGPQYSQEVAATAAWQFEKVLPRGTILNYLLLKEDLPEKKIPESRIYKNGGAWFYENREDKNSLAALLYNTTATDGHAHKEVNSVSLMGYGERLMSNSGYAGWANSSQGFTWEYINQRAISSSTVLVNYEPGNIKNPSMTNDHTSKSGAGIVQGFTDKLFNYARGNDGEAMQNVDHERSLMMVNSQDGIPGYYIVSDNIDSGKEGDIATVVYRPESDKYTTLSENEEYQWHINKDRMHNIDFSVFLADEPEEVEMTDGIIAVQGGTGIPIKSMLAKYKTNAGGKVNTASILFPSDLSHKKPVMSRINDTKSGGVKLDFENGVTDYLLLSKKRGETLYYIKPEGMETSYGYDRIAYDAENVAFRKINGARGWYFAENGKEFIAGEQGYKSNDDISIFLKNNKASVWADKETKITFYEYGVIGAKVNGTEEFVSGKGSVTVTVPQGESDIELVFDKQSFIEEILSSKVINGIYDDCITIDVSSENIIKNGVFDKMEAAPVYVEESLYVPVSFISEIFGSTAAKGYDNIAPLRKIAESCGWSVMWLEQNIVILSPPDKTIDKSFDSPAIGLVLKLFDRLGETEEVDESLTVDNILIDGTPLEGFERGKYFYTANVTVDSISEITVECDLMSTVKLPETIPGQAEIYITDGRRESNYVISFVPVDELKPQPWIQVTASAVPEYLNVPANTLDGDPTTRWSAEGDQWIMYDMGEVKDIAGISAGWYNGDTRIYYFEIHVSEDGENWETVFEGQSGGFTDYPEKLPVQPCRARYVKLTGHGNSATSWCSLTEFNINLSE